MAIAPCPHCQKPLTQPQNNAQHLARCVYCGGAWARPEALQRCFGRELPVSTTSASARSCPDCRVALTAVPVGPVELDTCPTCHGAFFDHGEIEKVQQLFQASQAPAPLKAKARPKTNAALGASVQAAAVAMAASAAPAPPNGVMDVVGSVAGGAVDLVSSVDASDVVSGLFSVLGLVFEILD